MGTAGYVGKRINEENIGEKQGTNLYAIAEKRQWWRNRIVGNPMASPPAGGDGGVHR
jgi:hypothetical protein